MNVFKVTIAVLVLFLAAWVGLRFFGLSQSYQIYDHPLMARSKPWIVAWGGEQEAGPSHTRVALRSASEEKDVILGVNILMNKEKHFFALPLGSMTIADLTDAEVKKIDLGLGQGPMSLEEILQEFGQNPLLLWVNDNAENIDLRLKPILSQSDHRNQILIHSEFDNVVKSLKTLIPDLLYGTGVGQRIRVLMLSSMGLESVAPIDGDFVITPIKERNIPSLSVEMKDEVTRRQKIFIIGPLNKVSENDQALSFGATGYLTAFPRDLKKKLKLNSQSL